jgi:hypothetical protein
MVHSGEELSKSLDLRVFFLSNRRLTLLLHRGVQTPGNMGTRDKTTEIFGASIERMNIKK